MPVRQYSTVVEDTIRQLNSTTNLTYFGKGSKARSLLETVAAELVSQSRLMESEARQGRISEATDRNLDLAADIFNIDRLRRRKAESRIGDLNVRFYVESSVGNFGNLASLPVINIGDRIQTRGNESRVIYEITDVMGTLSPAASVYYVGVRALQAGSEFNVGSNSLTTHSYDDSELKVTNVFPISNGRDDEPDGQYRFRVFNALRSLESANDRALFIAARITPGVGDVSILPRLFGIGTTAVVIRPSVGVTTPRSMITAVRSSISSVAPNSSRTIVTPPDLIGFEFEITLNYSKPMSSSEKSRIEGTIVSRINQLMGAYDIGQSLSLSDITDIVLGASGHIKSVGTGNTPLGRVWIYESEVPGQSTGRRRKEVLINNNTFVYSMPVHGLAVLEPSLSNPITIVHGSEG